MRCTWTRVSTTVALAVFLVAPVMTASATADQGDRREAESSRLPDASAPRPGAKYKGLASGEWLAAWWQEILAASVEAGHHPLIDGGAVEGANHTVFIGGPVLPAGSPRTKLAVTVPAGTHPVIPIVTVECSVAEEPPFHGEDEADLRACANGLLDVVTDPYAKIDGKTVRDVEAYRVDSPLFRYGPLTAGNYLGLRAGTQSDAVAAGYVLLLPPLSVGVHRISLRANIVPFGLAIDTEVTLTVTPPAGR